MQLLMIFMAYYTQSKNYVKLILSQSSNAPQLNEEWRQFFRGRVKQCKQIKAIKPSDNENPASFIQWKFGIMANIFLLPAVSLVGLYFTFQPIFTV